MANGYSTGQCTYRPFPSVQKFLSKSAVLEEMGAPILS